MTYKIEVSVIRQEEVELHAEDIIHILNNEITKLVRPYDSIIERNGKYVFYQCGYGACQGEGSEPSENTVKAYNALRDAIAYFANKESKHYKGFKINGQKVDE